MVHHDQEEQGQADLSANRAAIEELWRRALTTYREEGLEERLKAEWSQDANVTERITYEYPPTFQPGFVGPRYFGSERKVVLLGQNPGGPRSGGEERLYHARLEAFDRREISFAEVNEFLASLIPGWRVFAGKGIFRESGAHEASLIAEDVRPSIREVSYVNHFPFRLPNRYRKPRKTSFQKCVWAEYVWPLLKLLKPTLIIRYLWSDGVDTDLRSLVGSSSVVPVFHPSVTNMRARPAALTQSWEPVSEHLRRARA